MKYFIIVIITSLVYGCSCPQAVERTEYRKDSLSVFVPGTSAPINVLPIWRPIYTDTVKALIYDTIRVPIADNDNVEIEWRGVTDDAGEIDSLRGLITRLKGKLYGNTKDRTITVQYIDTVLHVYPPVQTTPWWERQVDKILVLLFLFGLLFLVVKLIIGKRNAS